MQLARCRLPRGLGGRRLQGAEEDVKVEYVIHFPGHAGAEVAIQAAERSKRALEEISPEPDEPDCHGGDVLGTILLQCFQFTSPLPQQCI